MHNVLLDIEAELQALPFSGLLWLPPGDLVMVQVGIALGRPSFPFESTILRNDISELGSALDASPHLVLVSR